jgi:predicted DNA-binding protein
MKKFIFCMPPEMRKKLEAKQVETGLPLAELIRAALAQYLGAKLET